MKASPIRNVGPMERIFSGLVGGLLLYGGLRRRSSLGYGVAAAGAALAYRGAAGYCPLYHSLGLNRAPEASAASGTAARRSITVDRSPRELYAYWRDVTNLPSFMAFVSSVVPEGDHRSRWTVEGPMGASTSWLSEIVEDREGERIAWRSLPGSDLSTSGAIRFREAPEGRGTEVEVEMRYEAAQPAAWWASRLFSGGVDRVLREDLRRFKQLMETGEVATADGQPSGRSRGR